MSIVEAEDFIDSFPDLSEEHKVHLKTLLDRNVVFPNTILGRTLESLRGVVSRNPLPVSGSLPVKVRIFIGDNVQDSVMTFTTLKRPLDTVKGELVALGNAVKHGMNLESFQLVTAENALVTDFASIGGQRFLVFHIPDKIVPLSDNEWTKVQLAQLKIDFEDVELEEFFSNAGVERFDMGERGAKLAAKLGDLDHSLLRKFDTVDFIGDSSASASANRENLLLENPLLEHPICKALFAAKTYSNHESFVDNFVKHLLHKMGFNEGSLYAAPQMRINLSYGETQKMATADVTILDLLSYARIGVVEDKNWEEMSWNADSTPQLVADGIAISQRNEVIGKKRRVGGDLTVAADSSDSVETVYGIRVTGSVFHFYAIHVSPHIHSAMRTMTAATARTVFHRYKRDSGLEFMIKEERDEIIRMLSLLQEVVQKTGVSSRRRSSKLGDAEMSAAERKLS